GSRPRGAGQSRVRLRAAGSHRRTRGRESDAATAVATGAPAGLSYRGTRAVPRLHTLYPACMPCTASTSHAAWDTRGGCSESADQTGLVGDDNQLGPIPGSKFDHRPADM